MNPYEVFDTEEIRKIENIVGTIEIENIQEKSVTNLCIVYQRIL